MKKFYDEYLSQIEGVHSISFKRSRSSVGNPLTIQCSPTVSLETIRATVEFLTETFTNNARKTSHMPQLSTLLSQIGNRHPTP